MGFLALCVPVSLLNEPGRTWPGVLLCLFLVLTKISSDSPEVSCNSCWAVVSWKIIVHVSSS